MGNEATVKVQLVGARRFSYKFKKYEQGKHYIVRAERAKLLLRLTTDGGVYVFKKVGDAQHSPVAPRPVPQRQVPVVDTTKTAEEQAEAALIAEDASDVDAVVVQEYDPEDDPDHSDDDDVEDSAEAVLAMPLEGEDDPEVETEGSGTPV